MIILLLSTYWKLCKLNNVSRCSQSCEKKEQHVFENIFHKKDASFYFSCQFLPNIKISSKKIVANRSQVIEDRNFSL